MNARTALALAALFAALPSAAQERPSELDLFGAPPAPAAEPSPAAPPAGEGERDDSILGAPKSGPPAGVFTAAQENSLAIGGQVYLRALTTWYRDTLPGDWPLTSPNLVDLYVDARPNDRVRAFALARTFWDPLVAPAGAGVAASSPGTDPKVFLDQLWINFDVGRTVFVTAGKQHVKWGVGRFWNPTDFLHPVPRNPLATFDARTGTTMVKLHVPWEARGWNAYGVALLDDPAGNGDTANVLGEVAAGGRVELVIAGAEVGADAIFRKGQHPRFGLDFSTGLWNLDVSGEVAFRTQSNDPLWEEVNPAGPIVGPNARYGPRALDGVTPQAVLGVSYEQNYSDEDAIRIGAEYFYNGLGYDDAHIYPWLIVQPGFFANEPPPVPGLADALLYGKTNDFNPFYVGRHYVGAFALLVAPGSWNDHTFTATALVNASDGSAILRLDHSVQVNTYLTVESHLSGHVGNEGGEFRFSLDVPPQDVGGGVMTPALRTQPPVMSAGVALRVKL